MSIQRTSRTTSKRGNPRKNLAPSPTTSWSRKKVRKGRADRSSTPKQASRKPWLSLRMSHQTSWRSSLKSRHSSIGFRRILSHSWTKSQPQSSAVIQSTSKSFRSWAFNSRIIYSGRHSSIRWSSSWIVSRILSKINSKTLRWIRCQQDFLKCFNREPLIYSSQTRKGAMIKA